MVYSLFRTDVLKSAAANQDITNEFLLCMIILGETRGIVLDKYDYHKRYPYRWPGVRKTSGVKPEKRIQFEKWRDETAEKAKSLFPELATALELIRSRHEPSNYHPGFEIVKNLPTSASLTE